MSNRKGSRIQGGWSNRIEKTVKKTTAETESENKPGSNAHKVTYQASSDGMPSVTKVKCKTIYAKGNHVLSSSSNGVSNVIFQPNFITDTDVIEQLFDSLNKEILWEDREVVIKGKMYPQPRLVAWFGPFPYEYSGLKLVQTVEKWPPAVEYLHECLKKEIHTEFNSVLVNLYRDGKDSIAWHSDNEMSMGVHPLIASISLGDTRKFEFRRKRKFSEDEKEVEYMFPLSTGSLIVMDGATQSDWEHRVPKEYHDRKPRINLTFRTVYQT